jgi:hypothetical protein
MTGNINEGVVVIVSIVHCRVEPDIPPQRFVGAVYCDWRRRRRQRVKVHCSIEPDIPPQRFSGVSNWD